MNSNSRPQERHPPRPETIDLTANDSIDSLPGLDQRKVITASFVNQIKQSSTQRVVPSGSARNQLTANKSFDLTKGRVAESTDILNNSPIRTVLSTNSQNMRQGSHGISAPNSHSSHRVLSNDSFNSSLNLKTPESFLPPANSIMSINTKRPMAPRNTDSQSRITRNRASTSQIAQRLSAHMKIGATPSIGLRGQTANSGSRRPGSGSSFNQNTIFRKRS